MKQKERKGKKQLQWNESTDLQIIINGTCASVGYTFEKNALHNWQWSLIVWGELAMKLINFF